MKLLWIVFVVGYVVAQPPLAVTPSLEAELVDPLPEGELKAQVIRLKSPKEWLKGIKNDLKRMFDDLDESEEEQENTPSYRKKNESLRVTRRPRNNEFRFETSEPERYDFRYTHKYHYDPRDPRDQTRGYNRKNKDYHFVTSEPERYDFRYTRKYGNRYDPRDPRDQTRGYNREHKDYHFVTSEPERYDFRYTRKYGKPHYNHYHETRGYKVHGYTEDYRYNRNHEDKYVTKAYNGGRYNPHGETREYKRFNPHFETRDYHHGHNHQRDETPRFNPHFETRRYNPHGQTRAPRRHWQPFYPIPSPRPQRDEESKLFNCVCKPKAAHGQPQGFFANMDCSCHQKEQQQRNYTPDYLGQPMRDDEHHENGNRWDRVKEWLRKAREAKNKKIEDLKKRWEEIHRHDRPTTPDYEHDAEHCKDVHHHHKNGKKHHDSDESYEEKKGKKHGKKNKKHDDSDESEEEKKNKKKHGKKNKKHNKEGSSPAPPVRPTRESVTRRPSNRRDETTHIFRILK